MKHLKSFENNQQYFEDGKPSQKNKCILLVAELQEAINMMDDDDINHTKIYDKLLQVKNKLVELELIIL